MLQTVDYHECNLFSAVQNRSGIQQGGLVPFSKLQPKQNL